MELSDLPVCPHCDDIMCCCASTRRTREKFRKLGADMYKAREDAAFAVFAAGPTMSLQECLNDLAQRQVDKYLKEPQ